eukprot:1162151-Pelagomonas_calceolata.AAC.3
MPPAQARDQEEAELQRQQQEQAQGGCHEGARQGAEPAKSVVSRRLLVLLYSPFPHSLVTALPLSSLLFILFLEQLQARSSSVTCKLGHPQ